MSTNRYKAQVVERESEPDIYEANGDNPAHALLLADLEALIAQEPTP